MPGNETPLQGVATRIIKESVSVNLLRILLIDLILNRINDQKKQQSSFVYYIYGICFAPKTKIIVKFPDRSGKY